RIGAPRERGEARGRKAGGARDGDGGVVRGDDARLQRAPRSGGARSLAGARGGEEEERAASGEARGGEAAGEEDHEANPRAGAHYGEARCETRGLGARGELNDHP